MKKIINKTHLGVYGILKKDEKILLIDKIRGPYSGKLDLPGGKIEHCETVIDCLKRELVEETGVIIEDIKLFDNYTYNVDFEDNGENISMHHIGLVYLVSDFDDSNILSDIKEADSGGTRWYDINILKGKDLSPFANYVISKIRK